MVATPAAVGEAGQLLRPQPLLRALLLPQLLPLRLPLVGGQPSSVVAILNDFKSWIEETVLILAVE